MRFAICSSCSKPAAGIPVHTPSIVTMFKSLLSKKMTDAQMEQALLCGKCYLRLKLSYLYRQYFLKLHRRLRNDHGTQQFSGEVMFQLADLPVAPRCPICFDSQPTVEHIYQHLKPPPPPSPPHCTTCGVEFPDAEQFLQHQVVSLRCATGTTATDQISSSRQMPVYWCSRACGASFVRKQLLDVHQSFCCHRNSQTVDGTTELRDHMLAISSNFMEWSTEENNPKPTSSKKFKSQRQLCKICGEWKTRMERHLLRHDVSTPKNECTFCHKLYKNSFTLKLHQSKYCNLRPNKIEEESHKCPICCNTFGNKGKLQQHLRIHDKVNCSVCKKMVAKAFLSNHMKIHEEEEVVCDQCGKTVRNHAALQSHIAYSHTNRGRYACDKCDMKFSLSYVLKQHQAVHETTVEKRFFCDQCGRGFLTSSSLRGHIRTMHVNKLQYVCTVCNMALSTSATLLVHMRQHTGEKPYSCDVCGKSFRQKPPLNRHRRSQHNIVEMPTVECPHCGKSFGSQTILKGHIVKVH